MLGSGRASAALLGVVVAMVVSHTAAAAAAPETTWRAEEPPVVAAINGVRAANGLRPLRVSQALWRAAATHSREMAARGYFDHRSADGTSFSRRVGRFYSAKRARYWAVGENILWASPDVDAAEAVRMWLNSPPHRDTLLKRGWRDVGISLVHVAAAPGIFGNQPVTFITADFGIRR